MNLLFDPKMSGTNHWRPKTSAISLVRVPPVDVEIVPYVGLAQTDAEKLVAEASGITGLPVVEMIGGDLRGVQVGLFYPHYEDSVVSHSAWSKSATEFTEAVMAGNGLNLSRLSSFLDPLVGIALEESERGGVEAVPNVGGLDEYADHHEKSACRMLHASYFRTGNSSVSVFAYYGGGASQQQLTLCLVKPVLSSMGLINIKPLVLNEIVDYSDGEPKLSALIVCALKVLYHPSLDAPGTPGNPAKERARKLLETEEICA